MTFDTRNVSFATMKSMKAKERKGNIHIKIPPKLHVALARSAAMNHRSITQEIVTILEQALAAT